VSEAPALVYLEPDDEITTVVRRVRAAAATRVVVVAPGRARATSSAVAMRLLARAAADEAREIAIVGDALTRSLAADAGLPAYGSIDDARAAAAHTPSIPPGEAAPAAQHAEIHVVRGPVSDETAPTMAVAPAVTAERDDETRPVRAVAAPPATRAARPAARRMRSLPIVALIAVVLFAGAGLVAGATILPAATITLVPRAVDVGPIAYEITVDDPERDAGRIEAEQTVTATGSYAIEEPARGVATFRNFNVGAVEVPAGTLVAAGEQAFETTEAVTVPSGSLTPDGRIQGGEGSAPIVAAAAGPDANVAAEAISSVLSQGVAARLRGFPGNTARLVINYEPTEGGQLASGPEITEADLEAALTALRAELSRLAGERVAGASDEERITVSSVDAEPVIDLPDGLVGTRDQLEVRIGGTLGWAVTTVDRETVAAEAEARFADDPGVRAEGRELLAGSVEVTIGQARLDGDVVGVGATVTGRSAAEVDRETVLARVQGRSPEEAREALAEIGEVRVELWPGWVTSVPELEWRVEVRVEEVSEP
jgi:hypothetical protein